MSKFDNLFKNDRAANSGRNDAISNKKPNSFVFKTLESDDTNKKTSYDYKETEFPDLSVGKQVTLTTVSKKDKNYANITLTVTELAAEKKIAVLPGWTQYTFCKKSRSLEVAHGTKTKRQIEQEQEDARMSNSTVVYRKMITTLEKNWLRYKKQYDKIHGEGAYDLVYFTEPIYPEDENFSDAENGSSYEHDLDYNSSNSHDEYEKQKKYSVSNKQ
jgi:hypothetical protein